MVVATRSDGQQERNSLTVSGCSQVEIEQQETDGADDVIKCICFFYLSMKIIGTTSVTQTILNEIK